MVVRSPKICITGGAGFIGSALIRALNEKGRDDILIVDDLQCSDKWKNLVGKRFVDIIPIENSRNILKQYASSLSHIVHLGACADTTEKNASYLLENNYRYSKDLAEIALVHDIRFLYASSAATYGAGEHGFKDSEDALEQLVPLNMYGYSKHLFDLHLFRSGLLKKVLGIKFFNIFGPNEFHKGKMASAVLRMVPELLQTGSIQLFSSQNPSYADGEQLRDFMYVKDAVSVVIDLMFSSCCGIVNVGSGEASSWNRLAKAVCSSLQKPAKITYTSMPQELFGKYQYFTQADTEKLSKVLQRQICRYSLEDAVLDYVTMHVVPEKTW